MQTESGPGQSDDRAEGEKEIVAAQIEGLSDEDVARLQRLAEERGITVEQLLAQMIGERFQQSQRSWLTDLWKQYFTGLRGMFRRSGSQPRKAKDEDS